MVELLHEVPDRVLGVYAHPDDAEVSCGGTLAKFSRAGGEVHLVVCTRGEKGTVDPLADPIALAQRRLEEVREAAALLGLHGCHQLGYPDGEIEDTPRLRAELVTWVRRVRPVAVLCPDPTVLLFGDRYVNHRDHRVVGAAVLDAVAPAAARPLYFPEAGPPHQVQQILLSGTLTPSVWVDISKTMEDKSRALSCHRSQLDDAEEWADAAVRERAAQEGRRAGVAHAEAFRLVHLGA